MRTTTNERMARASAAAAGIEAASEAVGAARRRRAVPGAAILPLALLGVLLSACGGGGGDTVSSSEPPPEPPAETLPEPRPVDEGTDTPLPRADVRGIDAIYPYRPEGAYAEVLRDCALADDAFDACPLERLPFLAQTGSPPSVEAVMGRVLVTHDWMGERFEELLRASSPTLVGLFGATTSIVIGSTVRPSNYWAGTGGIQLDPAYLWQSVEDKRTISIAEDFRSDFGRALAFRFYAAERRDGRRLGRYFDLEDRGERTFADTVIPVSALLYHELAHANDFLPPENVAFLDGSLAPWPALLDGADNWLSPRLRAEYPPASALMEQLAAVRYFGDEASETERTVTADVAGAEMANDGTASFYSYSTPNEDFAMLFEAAMIKLDMDVDSAIAFTAQPPDPENVSCDDLIVGWGVLNRLGDPAVAQRARWTLERVLGADEAFDAFFTAQSGSERAMATGIDFCSSVDPDGAAAKRGEQPAPLEPAHHAGRRAVLTDPGRNPLQRLR